ncbi:MAG: alpha-hydroxy-acid oxidizing protein [Alphaproteobacteria bacterium]|nr:alpha-hydroxy-acid oxidizing protein [Alphaproteobacteria bacterium]MDP6623955.1 alpha-hydroxy-acid oxidizing protein [Alphaproteobacteria bacterium]
MRSAANVPWLADRFFCVADARVQARRRMPRMMFDYVDGAAGNESASRLNCQVLDAIRLLPRVLVNVEERSLTKSFLDREWGLPFGIAPMGMCNLTWPGADAILAQAAVRHDIPLCLSTAASSTIEQTRNEGRGRIDWNFLEMLRERWPRTLMVKGVLAPADAVAAKERGVDALYVSNHGGRQLDSAPAAIHMLPLIRRAVGEGYPLIFDSGVRNGEGIVKALALGADFVMLGRAFLYAIGADGERRLEKIIEVLGEEISLAMAQIGRRDLIAIDGSLIYEHEIEN